MKRYFAGGVQQSGQTFFYSRDHLESIRELNDGVGAIKARYDYDPYGKRNVVSEDQVVDFGFTGHYEHAVSETTLTLFRTYDARLARWLSEDPAGVVDGPNLYVYASNAPVINTDRLGLYVYSGTNRNYRRRIDDAMRTIYNALNDSRRCDCQSQLGPDIWTMLQPGHPPVVVVRDLGSNTWGAAQGGVLFLDPDSFDISRTGLCFLESVILHELGHIVRRDTHDNEPPDFFRACNLGCIQPGRVR